MVTMIKLKCEKCGIEFERNASEVKRNAKNNMKIFCSSKCSSKFNAKPNHDFGGKKHVPFTGGSKRDEYSKFRGLLKSSKMHSNRDYRSKKYHDITLQDLKEQWEKQNGICPYTGWILKINETANSELAKTPDRASLDRIDSSKGYIKDNIQFVSLIAQYAKNGWDEKVIFDFCNSVTNFLSQAN